MKKTTKYIAITVGMVLLAHGCENTEGPEGPDVGDRVADPSDWESSPLEREQVRAPLPAEAEVGAIKHRVLEGEALTFVKYVDDEGNVEGLVLDEAGSEVDPAAVPSPAPRRIDEALEAIVGAAPGSADFREDHETIEVRVGMVDPSINAPTWVEVGEATIDDAGRAEVRIGGREVSEAEIEANLAGKEAQLAAQVLKEAEARRELLRALLRRHPALAGIAAMDRAIERGDASVTLPLRKDEITAMLRDDEDIVAGLELDRGSANDLGAAMLDTNIDPYALNYGGRRGGGIGIYMSEGGCPDPGHIPSYMRLSGVSDNHSRNVSAIARGVSPESYIYCRSGYTLPSGLDLLGYGGNPRVYLETHSWSNGGSDNASYQLSDRDFDNHVYDTAVAVFKSAGNFGGNNGYVSSPSKGLNLVTVGNYNDATDTIHVSSSFLDPQTGNEKPELTAPGTAICAGGLCYTGTSQAAPHAAGFGADLLGAYAWLRLKPYYLKSLMLTGSDKFVGGGVDKVGVGGLDFYRSYYKGSTTWWEGDNGSYSYFDSIDYLPNNGYIDRPVYLDSSLSNVRIALSWLNRGTHVYANRFAAHPIGMDMDICVFDPTGANKGCSSSWDNPYEMVSFDPTVSGTYRVRISRFSNNDPWSKLHMGLSIDW